jgi:voltage-gated potassium channel
MSGACLQRPGRPHLRRLLLPLVVLVALLAVGTVGYQLVEGWSWFDALYMTVITITTVGFLEVRPLGEGGRVFTMALALGGVFLAFYAAAEFIRAVVTGEIRTVLGRQRMENRLERLSGHLVICGFGRMGSHWWARPPPTTCCVAPASSAPMPW